MDFSNYKFSPSTLGKIMTNSKATLSATGIKELETINKKMLLGKELNNKQKEALPRLLAQRENYLNGKILISETTKSFLRGIYLNERYGKRYKLISTDEKPGVHQLIRGIKTENNGVALISEIDNKTYYQYKKIVENDYLRGRLDIIDGKTPQTSTKILDIKSADGIDNFFNKLESHFTESNIYQMQGYFGITGISSGEIVHCLVGEPEEVIEQQRELLFNKLCPDGVENDKFLAAWQKAESSMRFDDIPKEHRVVSKIVERDEDTIQLIYDTIIECRNWLNNYHQLHEEFTAKRYI